MSELTRMPQRNFLKLLSGFWESVRYGEIRAYLAYITNAFQTNITYRTDTFLRLLYGVITVIVEVAVWRALFSGTGAIASNLGIITLPEMVTYVIVSRGVSIIINSGAAVNLTILRMDNKIKTGEVAMDLIKPLDLKLCLFCETLGNSLFRCCFELIPIWGISLAVYGVAYPAWPYWLPFLIALGNGLIIYFLIAYLFGLLGFWYYEVWHFSRFLDDLIKVLSGLFVPLWFFPALLYQVATFLPFRLIYFAPITIYLQKFELAEVGSLIFQQFLWIGILLVIERVLWANAIKKLVIQGG